MLIDLKEIDEPTHMAMRMLLNRNNLFPSNEIGGTIIYNENLIQKLEWVIAPIVAYWAIWHSESDGKGYNLFKKMYIFCSIRTIKEILESFLLNEVCDAKLFREYSKLTKREDSNTLPDYLIFRTSESIGYEMLRRVFGVCPKENKLDLSSKNIGDDGCKRLCEALKCVPH